MTNVEEDSIHIHLHELGHTFGLDDFYDYTPQGIESFIMKAGASMTITEFDAWMARDWWTKAIKSRYPGLTSGSTPVADSDDASAAPSTTSTAAFSTSAAAATTVPTTAPAAPVPVAVEEVEEASPVIPAPSAVSTGFFPVASGNSTLFPTASGSGVYPTGVIPTGTAPIGLPPSGTDVEAAPSQTRSSWRKGHRYGRNKAAHRHEWADY